METTPGHDAPPSFQTLVQSLHAVATRVSVAAPDADDALRTLMTQLQAPADHVVRQ